MDILDSVSSNALVRVIDGGNEGLAKVNQVGGGGTWGTIEGSIEDQQDLQEALDITTTIAVTGAVSLSATAFGKLHLCSGTSANYTVDLPTAVGNTGKTIAFKGLSGLTVNVTLDGDTTETIDGALTRAFSAHGVFVLMSDGANWVVVHEIGSWVSWVPTFTGWSSDPTTVAKYYRVGKIITLQIDMAGGTSGGANGTEFKFTIPVNPLRTVNFVALAFNAGTGVYARVSLAASVSQITCYTSATGGAWTASGVKTISCSITFEILN